MAKRPPFDPEQDVNEPPDTFHQKPDLDYPEEEVDDDDDGVHGD